MDILGIIKPAEAGCRMCGVIVFPKLKLGAGFKMEFSLELRKKPAPCFSMVT
jgi:hypothetical protein